MRHALIVMVMAAAAGDVFAQQSKDGLWTTAAESVAARTRGMLGDISPESAAGAEAYALDGATLGRLLRPIDAGAAGVLSLPVPEGGYESFEVESTDVLPPEVATDAGGLKTYRGRSVTSGRTARIEVVGGTVTAMISEGPGTTRGYLDPLALAGGGARAPLSGPTPSSVLHRVYRDTGRPAGRCGVEAQPAAAGRRPSPPPAAGPAHRRTFRLAVGATPEYTAHFGGRQQALQAIGRTVNRINEVFERDFSLSFRLVPQQLSLIETAATPNPYANSNADRLLTQSQQKLDSILGSGGYDLGHVVSTGSGGLAQLGVLCRDGEKAQGTTGQSAPSGDPFDIDFVAHEIGHQLGANHTFNGTTGSCGGRNRNPDTAYEPGSGSTIMGYAGICAAEDLQKNSDPYFHAASLAEIMTVLASPQMNGCGIVAARPGQPPAFTLPAASARVPRGTPFALDVPPLNIDRVAFTWEEMDAGALAPPNDDSDGRDRPLFRSSWSTSSARTLPGSGPTPLGFAAPSKSRDLTFRVTVRDLRERWGTWSAKDLVVAVSDKGPFLVTAPTANAQVRGGSAATLKWQVADTDKAPFNHDKVALALSLDGGATYSRQLGEVPNTGTATVILPQGAADRARFRVSPVGALFFAESPVFRITAGP